jgi:hypothetical protein
MRILFVNECNRSAPPSGAEIDARNMERGLDIWFLIAVCHQLATCRMGNKMHTDFVEERRRCSGIHFKIKGAGSELTEELIQVSDHVRTDFCQITKRQPKMPNQMFIRGPGLFR